MAYSTTLSSLSDELFLRIISFLAPESLFSFATTHQRALNCSQRLLTQHQEWHLQFRIIHDRVPLSTPALLQRGMLDSQAEMWHLQRFESWGTRLEWSHWDTFDVNKYDHDLGGDGGLVETDDHTDLSEEYYNGGFGDRMEEVMKEQLYFDESEASKWMERIHAGSDEALKGLMIALAPSISTVIFVAHMPPLEKYPLKFLSKAISKVAASSPTPIWPPGFQSLTNISIASYTSLQHPHNNFYCPVSAIVPFFHLPALKALSLQVVGYPDDEEEWELPIGCSSIETLKLDCCEMSQETIEQLVLACRTLRWIEFLVPRSLKNLLLHSSAKDSLERINGQSFKQWLADDRYEFGYSSGDERKFYFREDVMLRIDDGAERDDAFELENFMKFVYPPTLDEEQPTLWFVLQDLKNVVPSGVEKVRFALRSNRNPLGTEAVNISLRHQPHISNLLQRKILELVEDPEYEMLKEVCLFDLVGVPTQIDEWNDDDSSFTWDENVYQQIVARGVDLHRPSQDGALTRELEQEEIRAHQCKHQPLGVDQKYFAHMTDPRIGLPRHAGRVFPERAFE
ncbi:uncharacterized protein LY89DRAFT_741500 [Mollisia scopiformis]|uniref:F-box domain-containing protein n=1 Tax=Mollisia scopiformis TaxID=149040 RepID=A0A132BAF9_MOLSC|nr:uncharacterized protein LY89DRAFT_741500 [Mollisia scopiformis]KUJ08647.1 hypothetical protein LY89DRAFT_741500 [Mollisia scopiformis]